MTDIDQKIVEAQAEWDGATNAYSRYPSAENWQDVLTAKRKVKELQDLKHATEEEQAKTLERVLQKERPTTEKVQSFLRTVPESSYAEIIKQCGITKDQLRHALLKLLKEEKIEKIKTGWYRLNNI
jgi:predicted Rossmann fold nucleotide-binding protein DprA/Smf involved in DNA uptake